MESSDDIYSASETSVLVKVDANSEPQEKNPSRTASVSSQESSNSTTRKRKRSENTSKSLFHYANGNKKVRIAAYSNQYRQLFNEVIEDYNDPSLRSQESRLDASQIGSVRWSADEKILFFTSLDRAGRDGVRAIAEAVGTKSEPEVEAYIQILEHGVQELHRYGNIEQLYGLLDMPAAHEVSPLCEDALEDAADGLAVRQLAFEEKVQQQKYGILWQLDTETMKLLHDKDSRVKQLLPPSTNANEAQAALDLLNADMFLETSANIFMNSRNQAENFVTFAAPGQTPSVQLTAFIDIYKLITMVTKRIVAASHFFALSRLQVLQSKYRHHRKPLKKSIRIRDVNAGLQTLGLAQNDREFWLKAARRCELSVYDASGNKSKEPRRYLSYDEVETILKDRKKKPVRQELSRPSEEDSTSAESLLPPPADSADDMQGSSQDQSHVYSSQSDTTESEIEDWSGKGEGARSESRIEKQQDVYLKALDQDESHSVEATLWMAVGQEPPKEYLAKKINVPNRPPNARRPKEDLVNWRSWLEYQTEWERYDDPVPRESFEANRRLMELSRDTRATRKRSPDVSSASEDTTKSVAITTRMSEQHTDSDGSSSVSESDLDSDNSSHDEAREELSGIESGGRIPQLEAHGSDVLMSDAASEDHVLSSSDGSEPGSEQSGDSVRSQYHSTKNSAVVAVEEDRFHSHSEDDDGDSSDGDHNKFATKTMD